MKKLSFIAGLLLATTVTMDGCSIQAPEHFTNPNLFVLGLGIALMMIATSPHLLKD